MPGTRANARPGPLGDQPLRQFLRDHRVSGSAVARGIGVTGASVTTLWSRGYKRANERRQLEVAMVLSGLVGRKVEVAELFDYEKSPALAGPSSKQAADAPTTVGPV
jgi:hypothetical protein